MRKFGLAVLLSSSLFLIPQISAHETKTGWVYPYECCHEIDCDVASKVIHEKDGSITVTTKQGTATFPKSFPIRASEDNNVHACFRQYTNEYMNPKTQTVLYCLFFPGSS